MVFSNAVGSRRRSTPSNSPVPLFSHASQRRQQFEREIQRSDDLDDPLDVYDRYIHWILEAQSQGHISQSGLLELLEQAARTFKDDSAYKSDPRYFHIWILYALQVEKPEIIFAYLLKHDIGIIYSQLYEEYALMLEREGRYQEAGNIYLRGLNHPCRAYGRLKACYEDFQRRISSSSPLGPVQQTASSQESSSNYEHVLRQNPLQNFTMTNRPVNALSPSQHTRGSPNKVDPYAHILNHNSVAVGRKPEKLRFDLSLLFKDGVEYCVQEARAKSMGLLGKQWGPPPLAEVHSVPNRAKASTSRPSMDALTTNMTMALSGEPTMTIASKQAMKDVYGMYNSPEKTRSYDAVGSKHAPIKKVNASTSVMKPSLKRSLEDDDDEIPQAAPKTPIVFRPFVDEVKKENATPALKFKPFVDEQASDENAHKTPHTTPGTRRQALTIKECVTPSVKADPLEGGEGTRALQHAEKINVFSNNTDQKGAFPRVFTPMAQTDRLSKSPQDAQDPAKAGDVFHGSVLHVTDSMTNAISMPSGSSLPQRVFSRPPIQSPVEEIEENQPPASPPQPPPVFTPKDQYLPVFTPFRGAAPARPLLQEILVQESHEPADFFYDEERSDHQVGGRCGQFNAMTPITERTFEYTTSTKVIGTPSEKSPTYDKGFLESDAIESAERLAAELREEEEQRQLIDGTDANALLQEGWHPREEYDERQENADSASSLNSFGHIDSPEFEVPKTFTVPPDRASTPADLIERTGNLSLAEAVAVASAFKPPNPCNPTDPRLIATLLSLIPADAQFYDFRSEEAGNIANLQKFGDKMRRRTSSSSSRTQDEQLSFLVDLGGTRFEILSKVGEGGFGAVFMARYHDDQDEEDARNLYALKVVKPRTLWEYHVVRRVHNSIHDSLRASVIVPHALYAFRDESYLVLDLCQQGTLLDIVNQAVSTGISQPGACLDELLVFFFAIELLRFIEGMHGSGFIHGDIKIDNCLLRLEGIPEGPAGWSGIYQASGDGGWKYKGLKMIDFGRTIDTRLFPVGQQFIGDWATDARDCFELRENRPWTYQTDYFGLAGIIYCMLFGKYFEYTSIVSASPEESPPRYMISTPFKRYWQVELWSRLFDVLLNPCLVREDASLPLCKEIGALRTEMEEWLQSNCNRGTNTLKGLLMKVEKSAGSEFAV